MSATETRSAGLCGEVEEQLAAVVDGTAPAALYDHIAGCDACRDLRHDAARCAAAVADAGADFRPAGDFAEALLERLAAARTAHATASSAIATTPPEAGTGSLALAKTELAERPSRSAAAEHPPAEEPPARASTDETPKDTAPMRSIPQIADAKTDGAPRSTRRPEMVKPSPARAGKAPSGKRRAFIAGTLGVAAAAAAVGLMLRTKDAPNAQEAALALASPWSGKVASVSRASADKAGGLSACDEQGHCAAIDAGAELPHGTTLRTDARTRAYVALLDGSQFAIDRDSRVWIGAGSERTARLEAGTIVLDVAKRDGAPPARIKVPHGEVEVLGTKLAITASEERASIEVARGIVRVAGERGEPAEVRAGEEVTLARGGAPLVANATTLADVMEWSDRSPEEVDAPVLRGLGELRARRPGSTQEKERAVRLAKHAVKVRIVDVVARTEIDETFTNDTDEELEGIFRFPLPPDAQIEQLALEVDGKLVEGAFVDRDRGAAIWRGVIQNAAPKAPKPREEIIWVPGPWRDPALLEWQRGGRFELRIFPIPKRGSRRVVLTYTQLVEQSAGVRRFTYPLAHDASGTTTIGDFSIDLQVLGHDKEFGVQTRGYELTASPDGGPGDRRVMRAQAFTPAGDLTAEYALPDRDRSVTAWAYSMPSAALATTPVAGTKSGPGAAGSKTGPGEEASLAAARAIASDTSPYVAIALRPKLPRWQEAKPRRHAVVVDASRSMFGERFARATRLASSIVREMDRRDDFILLACDTLCRSASPAGRAGEAMAPGAAAAGEVERFLGSIEPDGGSDLAAAVIAARAAAGSAAGRELRIIYLGDGTPSVGPTRASHIEAAVRGALPDGDAAVIAVALGSDADTTSLQALARGGGGVVIPYVPGQKVATAAQSVLGAAYGVLLRDPEIELPRSLTQITPARLDPIRAGGEAFVVARMSSGSEVSGTIRLRGRVSGEPFEQTYPVSIIASTSAGNAFVPRLFAAAKIAELERLGGEEQKPAAIELSKRFSVASRFTSLLVLESEAMFKAFGLDRSGAAPVFTGEESAESVSANADDEPAEDAAQPEGATDERLSRRSEHAGGMAKDAASADPFGGMGRGFADGPGRSAAPAAGATMGDDFSDGAIVRRPAPAAPAPTTTAPPAKPSEPKVACAPGDPLCDPRPDLKLDAPSFRRPPRRMIPMRRVFDRKVAFEATNTVAPQNAAKTAAAENALAATPDSRDKTLALYTLYATTGRLGEAEELTSRWSGRDALDPDALIARADLAARKGDRDRAVRILGGLADVRPGDKAIQVRLADLHDAAARPAYACQHRVALAELAPADAKLVAAAMSCARAQGMDGLANQLRLDVTDAVRAAVDRQLAAPATSSPEASLRGDVQLSAEWTGGVDLDLALLDEQGRRISWLGSTLRSVAVSSRDVVSTRAEALALLSLPKGSYVVEIARASALDGGPVSPPSSGDVLRGELTLRLAGETRKIPFTLSGSRLELGTVRIFFTSRLVPLEDGPGIFSPWR